MFIQFALHSCVIRPAKAVDSASQSAEQAQDSFLSHLHGPSASGCALCLNHLVVPSALTLGTVSQGRYLVFTQSRTL